MSIVVGGLSSLAALAIVAEVGLRLSTATRPCPAAEGRDSSGSGRPARSATVQANASGPGRA